MTTYFSMSRWISKYRRWEIGVFVVIALTAFLVAGGELVTVPLVVLVAAAIAYLRATMIRAVIRYFTRL